jgi:hypothetical protein
MKKKSKVKKVSKLEIHTCFHRAVKDIWFAGERFISDDFGGCLQNIEFALQQLETAKAKLMKI